ncbi:MAG: prolyl aminopeptidase [Thalassotalea sp.]
MSRCLYPRLSTYKEEWISVDDEHQLYLEQSGNPNGIPVIYLHGGPGGGSSDNHRRYFDPEVYRIILFDQRGCGRSLPTLNLHGNTTADLVEDINAIREYLAIDKWLVAGGSWGTTLALCYGIKYPEHVLSFILRGVFLATKSEYDWLYTPTGAAQFFPEYYREFLLPLPECERLTPLNGYHKVFNGIDELAKTAASKAWYLWELRLSTLEYHQIGMVQAEDTHQALCMAQLSNHYFMQQCFLNENYILDNIDAITNIPAILIHGRYDMVCQLSNADKLEKAWQNATLQILPQAGHSGFESQTINAMCNATRTMASFLSEKK